MRALRVPKIKRRAAGAPRARPDPPFSSLLPNLFRSHDQPPGRKPLFQTSHFSLQTSDMVLSDADIKQCLSSGRLRVDPMPDLDAYIGPCSLDLTLGPEFRVFEHSRMGYIDIRSKVSAEEMTRLITISGEDPFIIQPGELVLAATVETLTLPADLLGRLEGRSSLGRIGIIVHGTAPRFDPGFHGRAVMELGNIGPMAVALYPGMPICSMTFEQLSSPAERPYGQRPQSKYYGQSGPVASRLSEEK
jgi:dCTP deaminase